MVKHDMPRGSGLETVLHKKRRRVWTPCGPAPAPGPSSAPSSSAVSAPVQPSPTPSSPAYSAPSPALFVEVPALSRSQDVDLYAYLNLGSDVDDDSDGNNEEEIIPTPTLSRVYRSTLDTPLDEDEVEGDSFEAHGDAAAPADVAELWFELVDPMFVVDPVMTEQPWSPLVFDWREFPNPQILPELRREVFSETNVGPATPAADPYDIFIAIWDRQIMEHIASATNKYAQQVASQMLDNHNLHPNSRISRWCDTSADELYTFFAIVLAMGIVVKSRLEEYWSSTPDIFYNPGFSAHMSIDRFLLLSRCLHFADNDAMRALELGNVSEARLFKIQPILSHLNTKFESMYVPKRNISVDESLLMWKGWRNISQLIPSQDAHLGIKTYELCESQTGYLWRFEVHTGKSRPHAQHIIDPLEATTPATVLRLVRGLEYKGYTVWMDNYYNSPALARRLKSLGFDCVGTLRTDRKFVPGAIHSLSKGNMHRGQIAGQTSGDVDVVVWRDVNRVALISTYHGIDQSTVQGSTKPIVVSDFNIMMGGVDKKDHLLAIYPLERKRCRIWYKKLFRRLLNVSVLNSYIIARHHNPSITHRKFRESLIISLLSKHSSRSLPSRPLPASVQSRPTVDTHHLSRLENQLRRVCTVCKKRVRTICVGCDKSVCLGPCFLSIHQS